MATIVTRVAKGSPLTHVEVDTNFTNLNTAKLETLAGTAGAGTAAAPSISFVADTNTGLFNPAADTLAASTAGVERARIDSSGRLLVGTSTAAATGGVLQLSSGITFPAIAVASSDINTLDDYEEGTWTPSIGGNTTYSDRSGNYVKIGKVVYIDFYIEILVLGTGSATLMTGAPFNCTNTVKASGSTGYQASLATAVVSIVPLFVSATQIRFDNRTVASNTAAQNNIFTNGTAIYGAITYLAS